MAARVTGTLVNASETPLAGIPLIISPQDFPSCDGEDVFISTEVTTQTGTDSVFAIDLVPGEYLLTVNEVDQVSFTVVAESGLIDLGDIQVGSPTVS